MTYVASSPTPQGARLWRGGVTAVSAALLASALALVVAPGTAFAAAPTPIAVGNIATVAGGGSGTVTGDGGPATSAGVATPGAVATDAAGNLYIAQPTFNVVRKVAADGAITTVAGGGTDAANGIPATTAKLEAPTGLAVATDGTIYIAERTYNRIRMVAPNGTISLLGGGDGAAGFAGDNGPVADAQFNQPTGVRLHGTDLYIADSLNQRIRRVALGTGTITTVAGNGTKALGGDGGEATAAQLSAPVDVEVASDGTFFIMDNGNARVRKVTPGGTISTYAGSTGGFEGDAGGPATSAQLNNANGLALDASGNLYIADTTNQRVRKVTPGGTVSMVAGSISVLGGYSGDGGLASASRLRSPARLVVDGSGRLAFSDSGNGRVRAVQLPSGSDVAAPTLQITGGPDELSPGSTATISFAASAGSYTTCKLDQGNWEPCTSPVSLADVQDGDHTYTVQAWLDHSPAVTTSKTWSVDTTPPSILIYRKPSPVVVATDATFEYYPDGATTLDYRLDDGDWVTAPETVLELTGLSLGEHTVDIRAIDQFGREAIESVSWRIKVSERGDITTIAGTGDYGDVGNGGPALQAAMQPYALAQDSDGNLFMTDLMNYSQVRKIGADGIITLVAGNPFGSFDEGIPATNALLQTTRGLAVDDDGTVYITESSYHRIRRVDPDGTIHTVVGDGEGKYDGDGGPAIDAHVDSPEGARIHDGKLYFADKFNSRIRMVDLDTDVITTVAGTGERGYTGDGGPATAAAIDWPTDVEVGSDGSLYVADANNSRIRKVAPDGTISTVAGGGSILGDGGPATEAQVGASGLAIDQADNLYAAEPGGQRVRRIDATTGIITTVAGSGTEGFNGDNIPATTADMNQPWRILVDNQNRLYIPDQYNYRLRMVQLPALAPEVVITDGPTGTVSTGSASFAFTVTTDDDATIECQLDTGDWDDCTSPAAFTGLADGSHTFRVRANLPGGEIGTAERSWTVQRPTPSTSDESWVKAVYEDFLDRAPTPTELSAATGRLGSGTKRATIARELSTSDEWLGVIVTNFYEDTLDRAPDAAGKAFWVNKLRSGKVTVAQVASNFYSSSEYYRKMGGGTNATWVDDLYQKLLGRTPDASGKAYWVSKTASKGRLWVAGQFYGSAESRRARVDGLYQALLGRAPDPSGRQYWAGKIATQGDLALAVNLVTSSEYGNKAKVRFP